MSNEISQDVQNLATELKGKITIGDKGVATIDKAAYKELLAAEGIEVASAEKLQHLHSRLAPAAVMATGELSVPYLKKHKDIEKVELSMPMLGKDSLDVTIKRSKEVRSPQSGEVSTVYGAASAGFSVYSTRPRGEMAKVKDHLAGLAMKALG